MKHWTQRVRIRAKLAAHRKASRILQAVLRHEFSTPEAQAKVDRYVAARALGLNPPFPLRQEIDSGDAKA